MSSYQEYQKKKKKKTGMTPEVEAQAAKMFGKHVTSQKALVLLIVTLLACAMPIQLGLRFWEQIPEIVETGLIGANGQDDSLPRWAVVFAIPGLMCLLNLICHGQLWVNQKRMKLPPTQVRFVGRWGFPVISLLFCSGMMFETAGMGLRLQFYTPCVLGLVLMLLGGHVWDCAPNTRVALHFSFTERSEMAWRKVHNLAGWLWMVGGLLVAEIAMLQVESAVLTVTTVLVLLLAPVVYGYLNDGKLN